MVMAIVDLDAPFPWFGGKSAIATMVWRRLGRADHYIEPFFGSGAMLLRRPSVSGTEVVNDLDCNIANFWRAVRTDPEAVADHADWPVNEIDLHARHRWLVHGGDACAFRERMRTNPDYYDSRRAGWWCWGAGCWIGAGWGHQWRVRQRPTMSDGSGIHRGSPADRRSWLRDWFSRLQRRLREVRVCCGDWRRVCSSRTTTTGNGTTGVFLDPPYSALANRDKRLYACDSLDVAHDVREWCLEYGPVPRMRIALCGYEGEGHEELERHGWRVEMWRAHGGMANQGSGKRDNARRERIWFSPACEFDSGLFDDLED